MLFDDLDKKIKEAAEQHHPAYDENAWRKMEKLLNQHLPQQKDDRRRVLLFSLLLLLIGGGTFFVITRPGSKSSGPDAPARNNQSKVAPVIDNKPNEKTLDVANSRLQNQNSVPKSDNSFQRNQPQNFERVNPSLARNAIRSSQTITPESDLLNRQTTVASNSSNETRTAPVEKLNDRKDNAINSTTTSSSPNSSNLNSDEKTSNKIAQAQTKPSADQAALSTAEKSTPQRKNPRSSNGFGFFASAGPDVSKAGSSKTGKTTLVYGGGVSYKLNRFNFRTGVFISKKIYWANPDDYKLSWTPPQSVKFEGADANCDVLEIPVKLSYSFIDKEKSSWFAGAGLSSYLMKKESYVYNYKTNSSTFSYPYETKNENKHYFSILNLSA